MSANAPSNQFQFGTFIVLTVAIGVAILFVSIRSSRFVDTLTVDEQVVAAHQKRINQEIETLGAHPWAGVYYYGDGLGANITLTVAPAAGFLYTLHGCLGLYDFNHGPIVVKNEELRLDPILPTERNG